VTDMIRSICHYSPFFASIPPEWIDKKTSSLLNRTAVDKDGMTLERSQTELKSMHALTLKSRAGVSQHLVLIVHNYCDRELDRN